MKAPPLKQLYFIADVIKAVWAGKIMLTNSYTIIAKKAIYKLFVTSVYTFHHHHWGPVYTGIKMCFPITSRQC